MLFRLPQRIQAAWKQTERQSFQAAFIPSIQLVTQRKIYEHPTRTSKNGTVSYTLKTVPNDRDPLDDCGVDYTNAQAWMFACRWQEVDGKLFRIQHYAKDQVDKLDLLERDREILRQLKQSLRYGNDDVLDLSCETIILEAIYTKYCQLYPNV